MLRPSEEELGLTAFPHDSAAFSSRMDVSARRCQSPSCAQPLSGSVGWRGGESRQRRKPGMLIETRLKFESLKNKSIRGIAVFQNSDFHHLFDGTSRFSRLLMFEWKKNLRGKMSWLLRLGHSGKHFDTFSLNNCVLVANYRWHQHDDAHTCCAQLPNF